MSTRGGPTELVIFDCDGVLIDSEVISARMLIEELRPLGLTIDFDYVARHFLGRSYPVVLAQIQHEFGIELPPSFETGYRTRLLAAFEHELVVMPGVAEVLAQLALPACVATSSSPKRVARSLALTGLDIFFRERVFTASEVARGKPAPDLFLHVASRMGVAPEHCLVIEDSETGIQAALAANMRVCRYTGGSHLKGRAIPLAHGVEIALTDFAHFFGEFPELQRQEHKREQASP